MESKDLKDFFNEESAIRVADDLYEHLARFKDYTNIKNKVDREIVGALDYSYDLSKGKVKGNGANTWFTFDLKEGIAYDFMKAMYAREVLDEESKHLDLFIGQVATHLTNGYTDKMRDIVRSAIVPTSDPKVVPLTKVEVLGIEIVDYSSVGKEQKYMLKFIKLPDIPINMLAVNSRIMEVQDANPNMEVSEIIYKERLAANPIFDAVLGVEKGDKYLWDVQVAMFVDYSFSEEFLALKDKAVKKVS